METKDELIQTIREWIKLDNDLRVLKKEQAVRKTEKEKLSTRLIESMKQHNIDEFQINDGQIQYSKKSVKKPVTQKMLLNILAKYFENEDEATKVNTFILEHREEVVKETITRKINAPKV